MRPRVSAVAAVEVARPPADVFAYLLDVRRHSEWSPKAFRVEGLDAAAPVTVGTRFTTVGWLPNDKEHRNAVEVTTVDAPRRLVLTSSDDGETFVNTFTVTAAGAGSRVERVMDMPKPTGAVGAVFPVILATLVRPDVRKGLGRLKANLEAAGS